MRTHEWKNTLSGAFGGAFFVLIIATTPATSAEVTLNPQADGTLVDGGPFGAFDGLADAWDWAFNQSGYEGSITLSVESTHNQLEHRLVFEFGLAAVSSWYPVTATLSFTLRGAPRFPGLPAVVHVYVYPADLLERTTDFSVDGILVESLILEPYQPPTVFQVNVSNATSDVLQAGGNKVGFRFQIDPQTPHLISQAFMDALDSDPATKPVLVVTEQVPGDLDGDRDVDLVDFRRVTQCLSGPDRRPADCRLSDFDFDADVDMLDLQMFEDFYNSFAR